MFNQDLDDDCSSCHEILHDCVLFGYVEIKFAKCVCVCVCILCIIRLAVFHENWFSGMDAEH